ncbi:undecaprenyl-phosphate alpha-N-acetylglucosaminyl 1-phosphate transferase [Carboxydothermus islandicus]|uniref:Undecaprenyl-phosphate alpha-N-acetylglucosaminyl 1-phosphate transferase n=1 Tax=Carboxydothermus islandicus TaxID=661089 RepID=A0A1L8CYY8_9THEO|nr:MraY family glycosyltransferase [Carboxydothermus islandicus]GAV24152.1 undecaprenyl-phosphate alpha-N-acetylglucosaminyl 1-phosphate transferase [Carboxydothermus islandicus]
MLVIKTFQIFILALILTLILTPIIKKIALRAGAIDIPDARKVHKSPIPRMGGLAIFLSFTVTVLFLLPIDQKVLAILAGSVVLVIFGILDDVYSLNPKVKLLGQIMAAIIPVAFGIKVNYVTNPFGGLIWLGDASYFLTIFWIVAIVNAINLIDGLDGLASGTAAISAVFIGIAALTRGNEFAYYAAIALTGGALAFLKFNFNPAKIFLGDTGSMFLGYCLGILSVLGTAKSPTLISIFIPVLVMAIPIFDTLFAILRRFFAGRPIFKPDKGHLHHCILDLGYSQRKTVLIIYLLNILLGIVALYVNLLTFTQAALLILIILGAITFGAQKIGVLGESLSKGKTIINN